MEQEALWHEFIEDALKDVLIAKYKKGWAQKAAADMFQTESPIEKGKWIEHALDPNRAEKLALCDLLFILKIGREIGCHVAMYFLTDDCSYTRPTTTDPEDQKAELQRNIIKIGQTLVPMLNKLEQIK